MWTKRVLWGNALGEGAAEGAAEAIEEGADGAEATEAPATAEAEEAPATAEAGRPPYRVGKEMGKLGAAAAAAGAGGAAGEGAAVTGAVSGTERGGSWSSLRKSSFDRLPAAGSGSGAAATGALAVVSEIDTEIVSGAAATGALASLVAAAAVASRDDAAAAVAAASASASAATGGIGGAARAVGFCGGPTSGATCLKSRCARVTRVASMSIPSIERTPNRLARLAVNWPALHPISRQSLSRNHEGSMATSRGSRAPW
jgi:hypothetical protein